MLHWRDKIYLINFYFLVSLNNNKIKKKRITNILNLFEISQYAFNWVVAKNWCSMFEYVLNNVPSMIYLFNSSRMIRRKSNPMVAFANNSSYLRKEHGFDTCLSTNNKLWKLRCSQRSERATSQNCPRQLADPSGRRLQFWESSFTARGSSSSSLYLPLSLSLSPSLPLSLPLSFSFSLARILSR